MPMPETITDAASSLEIAELLHRALQQFDKPQGTSKLLAKLPKAIRPEPAVADELLQHEVEAGRLWQFPGIKGKPQFWNQSVTDFAKVCLMRKLQGPPVTRADALKALPNGIFGELSKFSKDELLDELIQAGQVHEWPALAGSRSKKGKTSPLISAHKPDPADVERKLAANAAAQRESLELLYRALQQFDEPQVTAKILKQLPKASCPEADLAEELLKQEVEEGNLWQYPDVKKKPQFWTQSPVEFARTCLIRELQSGPKPETDIIKSVSKLKTLAAVPATAIERMLSEMLQAGEAHVCPLRMGAKKPKSPSRMVSFFKPVYSDYLRDALKSVAETLDSSFEDILRSTVSFAQRELQDLELEKHELDVTRPATSIPATATQDESLLEAMRAVNPRVDDGDALLISALREELKAHIPGKDFDRAVLEAVYRRRFAIHRYDRPNLISEDERSQMIRDDEGHYYNTISLWRN
jgi:hypothetical protein